MKKAGRSADRGGSRDAVDSTVKKKAENRSDFLLCNVVVRRWGILSFRLRFQLYKLEVVVLPF